MDDETVRRREINDALRHDLRTRVAIARGYVAMLRDHHDALRPEQRAAAWQGLSDAVARLDEFSRRVLLDEKLRTREVVPDAVAVPVAVLLDAALAAYPGVVLAVAPDAPETAVADPLLVRDILDNLLANAVAAAPEGTDVTMRVRAGERGVRFEVHDRGPGVAEKDRAVLFERHGRTERSRGTPGTGLGLSIVRRLVEAHGGSYGAGFADGTTFWVELPAG